MMKIQNHHTPVLVLNCKLGGLAIMRSLGSLGVPVYGVDNDQWSAELSSRYCRKKFVMAFDERNTREYLGYVLGIGKELGSGTLLIATSDELSVFVAEHARELAEYFVFPQNEPALVKTLISKEGMYELAGRHAVPTAYTVFPKDISEVVSYAGHATFPVMLKGIHGNRLQAQTGKKMVIVHSGEELIANYRTLEDPASPNLMLQEYIPGEDDQIYIFNGYFNEESECLVAFTGHKIRQFPIHIGCASLGVCTWNQKVADITTQFVRTIGYKGILDIGFRWDLRDGLFKVLDINPRVGQAFRLFLAEDGMDVVRALYLDLTGQAVPSITPREGRKWVIEDFDLVSSLHYHEEGSLTFASWMRSFRGLEEGAWFSWKDPVPFFIMVTRLLKKALVWSGKKLRRVKGTRTARNQEKKPLSRTVSIKQAIKDSIRSLLPLSARKHLAIWVEKQRWLGNDRRSWWSQELIHDFATRDINKYHKFLWSHHLSYAAPYDIAITFGHENMHQSRKIFFSDLREHFIKHTLNPARDIMSVFEVGCSLGYQLRYMETDLFLSASIFEGIDIDKYTIQSGSEYLMNIGSKVRIQCADMEELDHFLGTRLYDVIVCTGVLMYLNEEAATRVVDIMMRHGKIMVAFAGLAHPDIDNSMLVHSVIRDSDRTFIHNIDSMVKKAGGKVLKRRWEGGTLVDGRTIYFVFAANPEQT